MRTIGARFTGNKLTYSYFVPEGDEPQVGDVILTSVSWCLEGTEDDARPAYGRPRTVYASTDDARAVIAEGKMATVVEIHDAPHDKANKFYIQLLGLKDLQAKRKANAAMAQRAAEQRDIRKRLDALVAAEDARTRYARIAAANPEAAALLAQLEPARSTRLT